MTQRTQKRHVWALSLLTILAAAFLAGCSHTDPSVNNVPPATANARPAVPNPNKATGSAVPAPVGKMTTAP